MQDDQTSNLSPADQISYTFLLQDVGRASRVSKIESSIRTVPGVDTAEMNFAERSVQVTGGRSAQEIIQAVKDAGYTAVEAIQQDDQTLLDKKERADQDYYLRLMIDMRIALGGGVPLMVYSLFIGEMTITNQKEQIIWLIVGIATAAVMYMSGKHFYVGAWNSFKNHSANMDTLIALGTGAAWLYSMVVVFFPSAVPGMARHVYFEASAMIIGLINLGLALELKARGRTSMAIKRLIGLQAKTTPAFIPKFLSNVEAH